MNLFTKLFKFLQSEAHALVSKFEDPVKIIEQGIRDLKQDFDESMRGVAQLKAIAISARKDLASKQQIAADYEQKAMLILKKAQNNELDSAEADRLAAEALKKRQTALEDVKRLTEDVKNYDVSLEQMEKKVMDLKNQIHKSEEEYTSLKARATVAKTTKKINKQLSEISSDSTLSMIEEMKTKIQEEENLAQAYGETAKLTTSVDDEINKAIGTNYDVQASLEEMKQKLLANPDVKSEIQDDLEAMKKDLES